MIDAKIDGSLSLANTSPSHQLTVLPKALLVLTVSSVVTFDDTTITVRNVISSDPSTPVFAVDGWVVLKRFQLNNGKLSLRQAVLRVDNYRFHDGLQTWDIVEKEGDGAAIATGAIALFTGGDTYD